MQIHLRPVRRVGNKYHVFTSRITISFTTLHIEAAETNAIMDKPQPLTVRCQCGRVAFQTPTVDMISLYHCHCTECRKQSGSAFGTSAIFPADGIFPLSSEVESKIKKYTRDTDKGDTMDCYFCTECGSRLFHRIVGRDGVPRPTVSVKGGCVEGLDWSGGKHIYVRSAVIKISDEWETYETVPPKML
ncbi:Mss4-like protein [Xylaria castorea]|nr:Mss4-like protein [Xylaria castorea]